MITRRSFSFLFILLAFLTVTGNALSQECSGGATLVATECGAIPLEGCCKGAQVLFCEGGMLCALDCGSKPKCGWDQDRAFYDCSTDGTADESGQFPLSCEIPGGECGELDGRGCCEGSVVRWCSNGKIQEMDCAGNTQRTLCGVRSGVVDCVEPGEMVGPVCGAAPEPLDTIPGEDTIHLDAVVVPDIMAPANCSEVGGIYLVEETDCGYFAPKFGIKQRGCAAVLVDVLDGSEVRPQAIVTKSGFSFQFLSAGTTRSCVGEQVETGIQGKCTWAGGECGFRFTREQEPEPDLIQTEDTATLVETEKEKPEKTGSGCGTAAQSRGTGEIMILLIGLLAALTIPRRSLGL